MTSDRDHRSALLAYATEVASADDVDAVYDAMADAAEAAFDFSSAVVETEDDGVLAVRSWSGRAPSVGGIAADEGIAGATYRTGDPQLVEDVREDARVSDPPADAPRSVISVPIGDIGVFQAGMDEPTGFDGEDVELAELLASHAYQAVERIRSQRELRESEARFRDLFEQNDDALVLYDVTADGDTEIRLVNDAAERVLGAGEDALRGASLVGFFDAHPEQFVPGNGAKIFETELPDDDRIFEITVKPFRHRDGLDAFAAISDVTEQRHREHTLTGLHDATRRMLVEDDPDDIAAVIVEAANDLLDLPYVGVFYAADDADELRPASVSDPVTGDTPPTFERGESLAWAVYESGEPETFRDVQDHPDVHNPETVIREEIIHPLGDHGVLMIGATEVGSFDSTDHDLLRVLATNAEAALDRAERVRQLRRREADLRREHSRLAALFENVPSPTASFVVEDDDPIVRAVNPAFEDVFGYTEAELVGENIDEYIIPADGQAEADEYNQKLFDGQNINVEVRRETASGPRDFLLDVVPFRLDEPNIHGYAMYTDITDRKQHERELQRQNDRLEEFASIVSHDLRNPLNVARGYLELAAESGDDEYFDRMDESLDRMHEIIESVLALARHGRSLDDVRALSVSDAAADAWRNVDTADATLAVTDDVTLSADSSRFTSLLENLFRNAVEHGSTGPRNEDGPGVTVSVGPLDGEAGFFVEDDGCGIDAERREHVFEYGETGADDGTGFGLAIVKSIADAHGWDVSVTSGEDGGARFEFRT
ncbi:MULTISPECIES: GAF domain-containing protein [Halobacterium]|uniref:GAF domain-containing sensor histidine kinase n=1 Tax=Halobacterium TaxID=2239 RepID=UPI00073EB171|nr:MULTISPECIES: GAF domain-containing protein [Halobacterium]MCG1002901.1 GAF domain-containing protein [Halobacterium noricense]